jgi:hypothetical protein
MTLMLRDITQAYPQSRTMLNREIYVYLPTELKEKYPEGTILRVMKPLYGITEAGAHWFQTYQKHHLEQLNMVTSSFDACLLIGQDNADCFGIAGVQTDDTLVIGTSKFIDKEETEMKKAKFLTKPRQIFNDRDTGDFNGCRILVKDAGITMCQKGQAEKLSPVKHDKDKVRNCMPQQYIKQRARGVYIASICQPEAAFDYSVAAQVQKHEADDVKKLNLRIN